MLHARRRIATAQRCIMHAKTTTPAVANYDGNVELEPKSYDVNSVAPYDGNSVANMSRLTMAIRSSLTMAIRSSLTMAIRSSLTMAIRSSLTMAIRSLTLSKARTSD
jgi:hypothetical protein